jgi:hypothetical protein
LHFLRTGKSEETGFGVPQKYQLPGLKSRRRIFRTSLVFWLKTSYRKDIQQDIGTKDWNLVIGV